MTTSTDFGFGKSDIEEMTNAKIASFNNHVSETSKYDPFDVKHLFTSVTTNISWTFVTGKRF